MADFPDPAPRRNDFPVLRSITTRWQDNDSYGHVNNVVHYSWFDTTVNGWLMSATNTDTRELPAIGLVAETGCRYLASLSFPEDVEIGLGLRRLGNSSITYLLAAFGHDADEPASLGRFVHVYVDRETRETTAVPDQIRTAVQALHMPAW